MKFLWIAVFVACVMAVAVDAKPANTKSKPKTCPNVCPADYTPVCGADINDSSSRPRVFSNECVMNTHNCEHKSNLVKVDFNKCQKAGGIRLS